jgi:formate dehydrogenase iron-sulfur subunit
MMKIYLSLDAAALSVGADRVAKALQAEADTRKMDVQIIRTGSRGLLWAEPLVEVETASGRLAFGPVKPADVPGLFEAGFGAGHSLSMGNIEDHVLMKMQQRFTFARTGTTDPLSIEDYRAHGGGAGLAKALTMTPKDVVEEVVTSGLRGRGGAGFPTGIKWRTVLGAGADQKYIVCNADEGDSGTFADRMLMEGDPLCLIEGMAIAGVAVGATYGYVYIRSEYPHAIRMMQAGILLARKNGLLGHSLIGSDIAFDMEVRVGAGAYVCGEETSLLESLEGKRGVVRAKPPLPALKGLFGKPTVINNVMSLAAVPWILANGGKAYADVGMGRSRGTLPVQLAGNIKRGGLYELAFGITLRELIYDIGGGTASGRPVKAVQVGGPLGAYFSDKQLDTPLDYEAMLAAKGMLGHGGVVVFDDTVNLAAQARFAFEFCAIESCGKCTPCRIGSTRGVETIDKIVAGIELAQNTALLNDLCTTMTDASLCALGGLTPLPVQSALNNFPEDFRPRTALAAE